MQEEGGRIASLPVIKLLGIIISLAVIFGILGFVYSFFGLLDTTKNIISLDPFRLLTVEEIGGHFIFGFVVGIPLRNLKASILIGVMALTIDSDHLLNIAGFHIQGRIDHSIPFAMVSSILMGFIADKVYFKILAENDASLLSRLSISKKIYKNAEKQRKQNQISNILFGSRNDDDNNNNKQNSFFILFSFITLSAFLSHIAYDVFVDDEARFPLLAPFSFSEFLIPNSYGLPIEIVGCLMALFISLHYRAKTQTNVHTAFCNRQGN
jgi:uncharacterized membrane protein